MNKIIAATAVALALTGCTAAEGASRAPDQAAAWTPPSLLHTASPSVTPTPTPTPTATPTVTHKPKPKPKPRKPKASDFTFKVEVQSSHCTGNICGSTLRIVTDYHGPTDDLGGGFGFQYRVSTGDQTVTDWGMVDWTGDVDSATHIMVTRGTHPKFKVKVLKVVA